MKTPKKARTTSRRSSENRTNNSGSKGDRPQEKVADASDFRGSLCFRDGIAEVAEPMNAALPGARRAHDR
jgi:hypothetical protein